MGYQPLPPKYKRKGKARPKEEHPASLHPEMSFITQEEVKQREAEARRAVYYHWSLYERYPDPYLSGQI